MSILASPLHLLLFFLIFITSCEGQYSSSQLVESTLSNKDYMPDKIDFAKAYTEKQAIHPDELNYDNQIGQYVSAIFQDKYGNFWFATQSKGIAINMGNGLLYFDKRDGLANNMVNGIAQDKKGILWLATGNGVSAYNGASFTNYNTDDGLLDNRIGAIFVDSRDDVWAATQKGVCRFNGTSFKPFELPKPDLEVPSSILGLKNVWQIMEDRNGYLWFARDGYGATMYDGNSFTHFTTKDGLCSNDVAAIAEDKNGNIWFGSIATRVSSKDNKYHYVDSGDGGVAVFDGKTFRQFSEVDGLKGRDIHTIFGDEEGNVWIGSKNYGVFKYDGEKMNLFQEKKGLTNNSVQCVFQDKDGQLWFGFSGGLFVLNRNEMENVPLSNFDYTNDPYRVKIRIVRNPSYSADRQSYTLVVTMLLDNNAHFISPKAKDHYLEFFDISLMDSDTNKLILEESTEEIHYKPVNLEARSDEPEEYVKITYKQKLKVLTDYYFEISGMLKFAIEPGATPQQVGFIIINQAGQMRVVKTDGTGC